jgi:hypothetical protein
LRKNGRGVQVKGQLDIHNDAESLQLSLKPKERSGNSALFGKEPKKFIRRVFKDALIRRMSER